MEKDEFSAGKSLPRFSCVVHWQRCVARTSSENPWVAKISQWIEVYVKMICSW